MRNFCYIGTCNDIQQSHLLNTLVLFFCTILEKTEKDGISQNRLNTHLKSNHKNMIYASHFFPCMFKKLCIYNSLNIIVKSIWIKICVAERTSDLASIRNKTS
jgi:hypothetical protein